MRSVVIWLTGLSGAGKSTIAKSFKNQMEEKGNTVRIVDGDDVRDSREYKLSFSPDDIKTNNGLIANFVKEIRHEYDYTLISVIAPFKDARAKSREIIGQPYVECFVNAGIDTVKERDTKGLYQKALNNEIEFCIGVDPRVPYENPENPEVELATFCESCDESTSKLINYVESIYAKN